MFGVVRTVSGNPGLLRVELAFVGFNVAEWATWVSVLAFAYQVGGAAAPGWSPLSSWCCSARWIQDGHQQWAINQIPEPSLMVQGPSLMAQGPFLASSPTSTLTLAHRG